MKFGLLQFALFTITLQSIMAYSEDNGTLTFPNENDIFILTEQTIDEAINYFPYLLINLCTPFEPLCKAFENSFINITNTLITQIPKVFCAKLDLSAYPLFKEKEGIHSYPSLIFYTYGRKLTLNFITNPRLIVSWVNKYLTFPSTSLGTIREVKEVVNQTDFVSMIYFGSNKTEVIEFESYAFGDHKRFFGKCNNRLAYQYYNITPGTIVLFKPFDEMKIEYNGPIAKSEIEQFVIENSYEYISNCNSIGYQHSIQEHFPSLFYFRREIYVTNDEVLLKYSANKYKGLLQFFICDRNTNEEQRLMKELNITESDFPLILISDYRKERRVYRMKLPLTSGMINEFIAGWLLGKMMPITKSKSIPYNNRKDGDIFKVVANTYYRDVIDNELDVFVLFHGDNCDYCDYMFPIYKNLAEKLAHNKKLRIASYDMSKNNFEVFDYGLLPWLVLFPSKQKINRVQYKGLMHYESFEEFLMKHSTNKIILIKESKNEDL